MLVYDDANFLFEHSDMCLSADPYTCRQDTRTGDGRFFVIENSPLEQLPLTLWILCATFYNVILEYARGAFWLHPPFIDVFSCSWLTILILCHKLKLINNGNKTCNYYSSDLYVAY